MHSARSTAGDALAGGRSLATSDLVASPGPILSRSAENVDVGTLGDNITNDVGDGDVGDGNARSGLTGGRAVLVILLDDDAVLADVLEGDMVVDDVGHGAGGARDGLDANTVVGVGNDRVQDADLLDDVILAATNRADRDAVTTGAVTVGERDVGTGVDGEAVILVLDVGTGDVDAGGRANIESIGVVATLGVTEGIIEGDALQIDVGTGVDAEGLDRGVEDVEVVDVGVLHGVGVEEFGLRLAAVAALGIPPTLTLTVDGVTRGTVDGQFATAEGDERTLPLLVAKGGLALEGDVSAVLELGQVKGGAGGDGDVLENNGTAAGLVLDGGGGIGKGARSTGVDGGGDGDGDQAGEENDGGTQHLENNNECNVFK